MFAKNDNLAKILYPHKNKVLDTKISNIFSTSFHRIFHNFYPDRLHRNFQCGTKIFAIEKFLNPC